MAEEGKDERPLPQSLQSVKNAREQLEGIRWSQYEQRMLKIEALVLEAKRDLQQIERDSANLHRGKITSLLERQRYLEAVTDQLTRRHEDYRSALDMLQRKSENTRADTIETERRLLERIESDAKDKRGLMLSLITAIVGALVSLIYTVSQA